MNINNIITNRINGLSEDIQRYQEKLDAMNSLDTSERLSRDHLDKKDVLIKNIDKKMKARQANLDIMEGSK
jgi:hypothetical protein